MNLAAMVAHNRALRETTTSEQAALLCLRGVAAALRAAGAGDGLLRVVLHLRVARALHGLFVLDAVADAPDDLAAGEASLTTWSLVARHRLPVVVDVLAGSHRVVGADVSAGAFDSRRSVEQLLGRDATHVLALPVLAPDGVAGMVVAELQDPLGRSVDDILAHGVDQVSLLVDLSAPWLLRLPQAEVAPPVHPLLPVIGKTTAPLVRILAAFARTDETVLLTGPTGSGKSRLARWTHAVSSRRLGPFVVLDLNSVPDDLQLGALSGWSRGAFTGAATAEEGAVAKAEGGTLFLDEVDKLSLRAQAGLLQLLEERRYSPLGAPAASQHADVRFVVGTNADLAPLVASGAFREDLYYRVQVLPVHWPGLADRVDEVGPWARWMVNRRASAGRTATLTTAAEVALRRAPWPGNLRQLDNVIGRAVALASAESDGEALVLTSAHVATALAMERVQERGAEPAALAARYVRQAVRAAARGEVPSLEPAAGLAGYVLAAAEAELGSREEAMRLFGHEALVRERNHQRVFKRELQRAASLARWLGDVPDPSW